MSSNRFTPKQYDQCGKEYLGTFYLNVVQAKHATSCTNSSENWVSEVDHITVDAGVVLIIETTLSLGANQATKIKFKIFNVNIAHQFKRRHCYGRWCSLVDTAYL